MVAEALADGAVKAGLDRHLSAQLVQGLFTGTSVLKTLSAIIYKRLCYESGGTTAAGYAKLEECNVRNAMIKAVEEAYNKACELAKNSFTLLETIISITILLVILAIFNKISHDNLFENNNYTLLNNLENDFDTKTT